MIAVRRLKWVVNGTISTMTMMQTTYTVTGVKRSIPRYHSKEA